jgi:phosphonate transport system substrate-binding protein
MAVRKLLGALLLCGAALTASARDLVLVSMSETPVKEMQRFQPLADHLAAGLKEHGITGGKVIIVPDIAAAAQVLRQGRGDMVTASPYPTLAISEMAGTRVVLRRWKNAKVEYHSVFVTRVDSPLKSLADLKGRSLAFESPNSTSGYFLPTAVLMAEGYRLRQVPGGQTGGSEEVRYSFSGAPENTAAWVLHKRVDVAAMGIHDWEDLKPAERAQLRILHATRTLPRQLVSLRGDLEPRLAAGLVERLKGMDASDEGRGVLQAFETTTRFDEIPEPARQTLDLLRKVIRQGDSRKP